MMLKLKLQYFGHLMRRVDSLEKTDAERDWGQEEKGTTEDEMAGWHHRLDGRDSEWTPAVGDGQGGVVCCDSWGRKESVTTEKLSWTELNTLNLLYLTTWEQKVSSGGNKQIPYILFGVIKYLLQLDCEKLKLYTLIPGATGR